MSIADFYSTNKDTINTDLLPVMNDAVDKLKALTCTREEHLGLFLQFLIKMTQVMLMTKFKPSQFCDDLINMNFELKISKKTCIGAYKVGEAFFYIFVKF